ncbi:MAG: alpha/beta hydrolase-fold protein [Lysobacterales bacterium]
MPLVMLLAVCAGPAEGKGTLEGPVRIHSAALGYTLQYWIYLPDDYEKPLPELYITDGQTYLSAGGLAEVVDDEIDSGRIVPIAAIFVDSRNPDDVEEARRNKEFMCNVNYGKFFVGELMPEVSRRWTGADKSTRRGLMGVSLGAINTACFGVMLPGVFQTLIMHSPGGSEHLDVINRLYQERPRQPGAFFLSHGSEQDYEAAAVRFVETLREKGYPVREISTSGGHDWENWRPLLDDSLRAFAGTREEDEIR